MKRVRWYHVLLLGVAVLVCAAAIGFFTSQTSARDDATAQHTSAKVRLAEQRDDTASAERQNRDTRQEMKETLGHVEAITTSVREFSDLLSQEVDAEARLHAIALRLPDSVDEFNAAVDTANGTAPQIQAKADAILEQIESFRDDTAQYTVATSSR